MEGGSVVLGTSLTATADATCGESGVSSGWVVPVGVTVRLTGSTTSTSVSGGDSHRIFCVLGTLILEDLLVTGGSMSARNSPDTFNPTNSQSTGSHPAGGAIFVASGGRLETLNVNFQGNRAVRYEYYATGMGGAVALADNTYFVAVDTTFTSNNANGWVYGGAGGAVFVSTTAVFSATGCTFTSNGGSGEQGNYYGGAVYVAGTFTAANVKFVTNSIKSYGGAVYVAQSGGSFVSSNAHFSSNVATSGGTDVKKDSGATYTATCPGSSAAMSASECNGCSGTANCADF